MFRWFVLTTKDSPWIAVQVALTRTPYPVGWAASSGSHRVTTSRRSLACDAAALSLSLLQMVVGADEERKLEYASWESLSGMRKSVGGGGGGVDDIRVDSTEALCGQERRKAGNSGIQTTECRMWLIGRHNHPKDHLDLQVLLTGHAVRKAAFRRRGCVASRLSFS